MMKINNKPLFVLGIGDAGILAAQLLFNNGVEANYLGIGNCEQQTPGIKIINFSSPKREYLPDVRRFLVPDMSFEASLPAQVDDILEKDFHFLLFAGLGGYTGTKLTASILVRLIENNSSFNCIATFPFRFEGKMRTRNADFFMRQYAQLEQVNIFHLDEIAMDGNILLRQALEFATLKVAEIANKELELDLQISYPEIEKINNRGEARILRLIELRKSLLR